MRRAIRSGSTALGLMLSAAAATAAISPWVAQVPKDVGALPPGADQVPPPRLPPGADRVPPPTQLPPGADKMPPPPELPPGIDQVPTTAVNPALVTSVSPCRDAADADCDSIPDAVEAALLARFTPYFLFSKDPDDEAYAPADAEFYVERSELQTFDDEGGGNVIIPQPQLAQGSSQIIFEAGPLGTPDIMGDDITRIPTDYRLDPLESLPDGQSGNPARHGNPWPEVLAKRNVGLYGHVVPVTLRGAYSYAPRWRTHDPYHDCWNGTSSLPPPDPRTFYKIEYWQFFGFNEADEAEIGNHEGDWDSVQIIYDPHGDVIRSVMHYAHGLEFRFDITPEAYARQAILPTPDGEMQEIRYCNYFKHFDDIDLSEVDWLSIPPKMVIHDADLAHAQNNVVRLFKAPTETRYEHPVVYIESGAHEFYPTERWSFYGAPKHGGDSFHYLAAAPPNLGEIDHPLAETPAAFAILRFNGLWGTWGNHNTPQPGPPLHLNWQPVAGSPSEKWLSNLVLGF
jgi:hypothetical protein